jgi:hypothetical protein
MRTIAVSAEKNTERPVRVADGAQVTIVKPSVRDTPRPCRSTEDR